MQLVRMNSTMCLMLSMNNTNLLDAESTSTIEEEQGIPLFIVKLACRW